MHRNITYNSLVNETLPHESKKIIQHILVCQYSHNEQAKARNKILLFRRLSFIVVKQVNNFFFLARNYGKSVFHTKDELVAECFITLDRCAGNFDWINNRTNFYLYYNKSLSRDMFRLFERHYLKHGNCISIEEKHHKVCTCEQNNDGLIEHYMDQAKLNDQEKRVVESRLKSQRLRDFYNENEDMSGSTFYKVLDSAKEKLSFLKDGEDIKNIE